MSTPKEAAGALVVTEISEDNGVTWNTIVCEEQSKFDGSTSVNETKTKCATYSAPANNAPTITGNGVAGGDLAAGQVSYQRLQQLRDANTLIAIRRQNAALGTLSAGEITYAHGNGYVTSASETAQEGDIIKFDFTLTFTGTVHYVPGS